MGWSPMDTEGHPHQLCLGMVWGAPGVEKADPTLLNRPKLTRVFLSPSAAFIAELRKRGSP